ncbi:Mannosyl-oligosaccharide 1,2-alpha-mannosidase MNS1 [Pseudocercospora fuligena]|uniref:alpha-1,2-Mannosidase n=1 Tax=Pseudocercospora fuligena TaxID=685502 RepID=A0A8H6R814_9PEZI|nr:Mannosyl-oligosaccharide 1,2-alpha-mannosidase MNS1 [Pseudocercospora fuligena]
MISLQRYALYAVIAILAIITVTHFHDGIATQARIHYAAFFPGAKKQSNGRFDWSQVPVHYAPKSLTSIPKAKPKKLPQVQFDFPKETPEHAQTRKERQAVVKAAFERCWSAYKQHAWMADEVKPISGQMSNGFGGWAATLVDSLDVLWIMGLKDDFEEAVKATMTIDLGKATQETVNVFETTIRHLGGLLSAYDLSEDRRLLEKAIEFGEMLLKAFDTPNHMPITRWKPQEALNNRQVADSVVLVAEIGSLTMEFTRLSMVTGDMRWYDAVDRVMKLFSQQQEETHLPGMWPVVVDGKQADFTQDTYFTLSAMSDSLYEYFPKMHALLGGTEPIYQKMYLRSMETAIKHNLWKPMTPEDADILLSGNVRAEMGALPRLEPQGQHLVCFAGGMFALGGRLMSEEAHVKIGKKLTDGCIWTYRALPMGVMPETFEMIPCPSRTGECPWNEQKWKDEVLRHSPEGLQDFDQIMKDKRLPKGFTEIRDTRYILRPEAIESVFILYRATGDETYFHRGWDMFTSIINATETPIANAALADITWPPEQLAAAGASVKMDSMESFWLAETLKYFYLLFSEPSTINLDEWVFNTEAHPLKRALPT